MTCDALDVSTGENAWTGLTGTPEAIRRDDYNIDPISLKFCLHAWINGDGLLIRIWLRTRPAKPKFCRTVLVSSNAADRRGAAAA
jgi:hypothetical protein